MSKASGEFSVRLALSTARMRIFQQNDRKRKIKVPLREGCTIPIMWMMDRDGHG
jgi:hypothetical protein